MPTPCGSIECQPSLAGECEDLYSTSMLCRRSFGRVLPSHAVTKRHTRQDPVYLERINFLVGNYKRTSLSRAVVNDMPITRARVKTMGERRYKPQLPSKLVSRRKASRGKAWLSQESGPSEWQHHEVHIAQSSPEPKI